MVSKWPYGGLYWLYNWLMTRSAYLDEWDAVWVTERVQPEREQKNE